MIKDVQSRQKSIPIQARNVKFSSNSNFYVTKYWLNSIGKGSDWIRLVFAHTFPLNSGAPIASANFISACPTNRVIQDQQVGTIQLLFQSDPLLHSISIPIPWKLRFQYQFHHFKDAEMGDCSFQFNSFQWFWPWFQFRFQFQRPWKPLKFDSNKASAKHGLLALINMQAKFWPTCLWHP